LKIQKKKEAIQAYILAKDGNRPFLLNDAFAKDAQLQMKVKTDSINFPSSVTGLSAIANTLVSEFNQTYENIYTFCISAQPDGEGDTLHCLWLVVMTEKRIKMLSITIDLMEKAPSDATPEVLRWVSKLPYPWCDTYAILANPPSSLQLERVLASLQEASA